MANENTVEVLQDGQLAIATVAQSGTIISGRGDETPFALVSTDEGNQLALKTVNVGEGGGGGGGSVPSLTWFTGNAGQILDTDIADLSTKPLVKVYKNGGLLQPGASSSTDIWYVGGSGKNISINDTAPISTAATWELQTTIKWQESGGGSYPSIVGYTGQSDNKAPTLAYEYSHLGMFISSTGSGWDITTPQYSTFNPLEGTVYEIKMGYDGTTYYLDAKAEGESNFTRYQSVTSSAKAYCSVPWMFLNNDYNLSRYYSISPLNIDKTKIIIDNEVWFDGSDASSYTNNGCTQTLFIENDYAVSGENLLFNTALLATDKICVETY